MKEKKIERASEIDLAVVGLGLMGSSIIAALLISNHKVIALAPISSDVLGALDRIKSQLLHCEETNLLNHPIDNYLSKLIITEDYSQLSSCKLVLECVTEIQEIKKQVYDKIAAHVDEKTIIASNTSAIPISTLQKLVPYPERFLGIHWAEPAYLTRFLEITCGEETDIKKAKWIWDLSHLWGKEATLLRKDIRGFITNRLMYAVYREGLDLIQNGDTNIEDVDKAFRYDAGSWMTLMGIFRRMDYLGLEDSLKVLNNIYPKLSNNEMVPQVMLEMIKKEARGIHNLKGLFDYSPEEAKEWEQAFEKFNQDIFKLAAQYPSNLSKQ